MVARLAARAASAQQGAESAVWLQGHVILPALYYFEKGPRPSQRNRGIDLAIMASYHAFCSFPNSDSKFVDHGHAAHQNRHFLPDIVHGTQSP